MLIDATGEYRGSYDKIKSIDIGNGENIFHYSQLTIDDMFFLLKPSPRTQTLKLMEAIRSLKMVKLQEKQYKLNITEKLFRLKKVY